MQELIEFFEMVSLNEVVLRGPEKLSILKARLALSAFNRAMETLKWALSGAPATAHPRIASPPGDGAGPDGPTVIDSRARNGMICSGPTVVVRAHSGNAYDDTRPFVAADPGASAPTIRAGAVPI